MKRKEKNIYISLKTLREESRYDIETAHYLADQVLCAVLAELGYEDFVDVFEDTWKWYS